MNKAYSRINWENYPSLETPVNEQNLNKIDASLDEVDNRIISLDTTKATKSEVAPLIKEIVFNESNGIFTITRKDGSSFTIDTKLEKIAVNFTYNPTTQQIVLILIDGTKQYIDLSALITEYEFLDTDTISFFIDTDGKISAIVKEGSIQEKHLQPNYLAEIKVEVAKAEASKTSAAQSATDANVYSDLSRSYAVGTGGQIRPEDTEDNAKKYSEKAKSEADTAKEYLTKVEKAGEYAVQAVQEALDMDAPSFTVDLKTGHLMYDGGRFIFNVNSNGHLEWGLAV